MPHTTVAIVDKFNLIFDVVEKAGLKQDFKPVFRPPAWRMSPGAIEAAKDLGIQILALSPKQAYRDVYAGAEDAFLNVVYCTSTPPFDPLTLCSKTEVVYHACEWDKNYLDEAKTEELAEFLRENSDKVEFCFMEDM